MTAVKPQITNLLTKNTKSRFYLLFLMAIGLALTPMSALQAQQCDGVYQTITDLRQPAIGAFNQWSALYGDMATIEEFTDLVTTESGTAFVLGTRRNFRSDDADVVFLELDTRGRIQMEKNHVIEGLQSLTALVPFKDGWFIAGNKRDKDRNLSAWIAALDADGNVIKQDIISRKNADMTVEDMIVTIEGDGLALAMYVREKSLEANRFFSLYRVSPDLRVKSQQSLMSGMNSRVRSLTIEDGQFYVGVGHIITVAQQHAGWVIKMNKDGSIVWQRQYARGAASVFRGVNDYLQRHLLVIGDSNPMDDGNKAGWIMMLDSSNGDILWQRFYRTDRHVFGRDVSSYQDGPIVALFDMQTPADIQGAPYTRLLTLSPRGFAMEDSSFFNSKGTSANSLSLSPTRQPVIAGSSIIEYEVEPETINGDQDTTPEPSFVRSREGWALSAGSTEIYKDPCMPRFGTIPP